MLGLSLGVRVRMCARGRVLDSGFGLPQAVQETLGLRICDFEALRRFAGSMLENSRFLKLRIPVFFKLRILCFSMHIC